MSASHVAQGSTDDQELVCYVNGRRLVLPQGRGEQTLLQFLREKGLTGTKLGCGEGGCGACTVMVSHWDGCKVQHRAVNACLCPVYSVEGMHVVTVEGIGSLRNGLHPVQAALANSHGSQCGFCTPGFVMSMYSLLRGFAAEGRDAPTEEDIEECLAGNLCRCTGYRPILDAFKVFAKAEPAAYTREAIAAAQGMAAATAEENGGSPNGSANGAVNGSNTNGSSINGGSSKMVCPSSGLPCDCGGGVAPASSQANGKDRGINGDCTAAANGKCNGTAGCNGKAAAAADIKPSSEPIFPKELKGRTPAALCIPGPLCTWYRPTSLQQLLALKAAHNDLKLVAGNSEVGVELKFKDAGYKHMAAVTHVPELTEVDVTDAGLRVGAGVTLTALMNLFQQQVATQPRHKTRGFAAAAEQLRWFAGRQIRNVGTLGGNIATASPISDLNPLWMAFGAVFTVVGEGTGQRQVKASDFFLGYRKVDMAPHEVLLCVDIPFTRETEFTKEYKQSPRRDDDIAIVNAGIRVRLEQQADGWVVAEAGIAYGGVAAKTIMADATMAAITGKAWNQDTLTCALTALRSDVAVGPNAPGGRPEYRNSLAASFLFKFYVHVCLEMTAAHPGTFNLELPEGYTSAAENFHRPPMKGVQFHHPVPEASDGSAEVGKDYRHMSADLQVSGQAQYTDDVPLPPNTLHAAFVTSSRPHAKLVSVDASAAVAMPGVAGYFGAADVPGSNWIGPIMRDEEVFATDTVTCVGQVIGVVVADSEPLARRAAKAVKVEYEDLPAVISIEDAIAANSYYDQYHGMALQCGDLEAGFAAAEHVLEGTIKLGGQDHFYLETNASIVIPTENDEYTLISSTQAPDKHHVAVASTLGLPMNKLVCKTKRLGGGFGGKETRSVFIHCAAAVPAYHTRRPVKAVLDRDEDMQMTGTRHPFLAKYRVGFTSGGQVTALDVELYNNVGNSWDLSSAVMDRALMHADCVYNFPVQRVRGHMCKTNIASNTAFRGFGGPQGLMVAELIMERVSKHLGQQDSLGLRQPLLYKDGDSTHFGMVMERCQVVPCWEGVLKQAGGWGPRRAAVDDFNRKNRWRKRGLSLTPTKFGIAFTKLSYNQGGALVHVYTDGTVLVTHGGVEMGQGLHTKVAQLAAQELGIPVSQVFIAETSTDKVPNASPTAGSVSTDLYGMAVLDACKQISARLARYKQQAAAEGWSLKDIATQAYNDRVDLSAHGFFATPEVTGFGGARPFNYFVFGAAVSEVELDTLTGDWHLLRTDIVMDVGNPINPAIDIGQVEGGFVQGMGWLCLEEMIWGDKAHTWVRPGHLFNKGPGAYKIPTANDVPIDFRVTLLQNTPEPRAVHSSKAVGEPPFHLGAAVFFALKDAVYAAREAAGHTGWFNLDAPATAEKLRMACVDELTAPYAPQDLQPLMSC